MGSELWPGPGAAGGGRDKSMSRGAEQEKATERPVLAVV
jgi:hypothetical protein